MGWGYHRRGLLPGCCLRTGAPERRRRFLLRSGLALVLAFFVLRAINIYGDPGAMGDGAGR